MLGQRLVRLESNGARSSGLIVEAEAYGGQEDLACHGSTGRTPRNEVLWGAPGRAYVYFTYGMHWMLNLVTEADDIPCGVLLRAILPLEGQDRMRDRRITWRREKGVQGQADWEMPIRGDRLDPHQAQKLAQMTDGPAKICQALQIDGSWSGHDICAADSRIFIEKRPAVQGVTTGPRVGLNGVPEPWLSKPWRFRATQDHYGDLMSREREA